MSSERVVVKATLDRVVAEFAGKTVEEVSAITEMFLQEVARALVTAGGVRLDRLGTLHIATRRGVLARGNAPPTNMTKYYVYFMKSDGLRAAIAAAHSSTVKTEQKKRVRLPWKNSELAKTRRRASRRRRQRAAQAAGKKS